jgi:hypothetical protein
MAARRRLAKLEGSLSPLATTLLWRMVPVGSLDRCVPFVMVDHDYLYAPPTRILAKGACVRELRLADVRRTIAGLGSGRLSAQAPVMTNGNTPGWHGFVKRLSQRLTEPVSGAQEDAWFILCRKIERRLMTRRSTTMAGGTESGSFRPERLARFPWTHSPLRADRLE